jgi:hypothetical protein
MSLGFNLAGSLAAIDKWVQDMNSDDDDGATEDDDEDAGGCSSRFTHGNGNLSSDKDHLTGGAQDYSHPDFEISGMPFDFKKRTFCLVAYMIYVCTSMLLRDERLDIRR